MSETPGERPLDFSELGVIWEERNRYRKTLEWIAGRESGIWGVEAHKALHPELHSEKSKHDADCLRRKDERRAPYLCTCDMTDQQVEEANRAT